MTDINLWIDSVVVGTLITVIIYLFYKNFKTRNLLKTLSEMHIQLLGDSFLIEQEFKRVNQIIENNKLEQSDGFIKFISDSRDWAFEYIEQVQKALAEFDEEVSPQLEWAITYGTLSGETVHTSTINKISEAYDKLKSVLPENNQTPNN